MKRAIQIFVCMAIFFIAALMFIPVHAQDSTGVIPGTTISGLPLSWLKWITIILLVYDGLVRIIPTKYNYAIISRAMAFLKWLTTANNIKA